MHEGFHPCIHTQVNYSGVPALFTWYLLHVPECQLCTPTPTQIVHSDARDNSHHFSDSGPSFTGPTNNNSNNNNDDNRNAIVTGSTAS